MAQNNVLRSWATSSYDFYGLLDLPHDFVQKDLDRAKRFTSLKYHPDKAGDDAEASEKLHMTNIGYEILNDPDLRSLYDSSRIARERKKAQDARLREQDRKLKQSLEARELAAAKECYSARDRDKRIHWLATDGEQKRLKLQARLNASHQLMVDPIASYHARPDISAVSTHGTAVMARDKTATNPFAKAYRDDLSLEERALNKLRETTTQQPSE